MSAPARALVRVRVVPRAARPRVTRNPDGGLRVHVSAPPVDGKANAALLAVLAEHLGVPRSALTIARGARGRDKTVAVAGLTADQVAARIAAALGSSVDKAPRGGYC